MAVEQFLGKWKLSDADSENFDKYLQTLGMAFSFISTVFIL